MQFFMQMTLCIFNETIGRLQRQLNILNEFCIKYGLNVNLKKTNIIVFRNGGQTKKHENIYLQNKKIEHIIDI